MLRFYLFLRRCDHILSFLGRCFLRCLLDDSVGSPGDRSPFAQVDCLLRSLFFLVDTRHGAALTGNHEFSCLFYELLDLGF